MSIENGKYKLIPLTQGKFAIIDTEDFERVNQYKWQVAKRGRFFYATAYLGKRNGKYVRQYMHRFILNALPEQLLDHINYNGLNNRKSNLRFCSKSQNAANSIGGKNRKSRYKGVYWQKDRKKWAADIRISNKTIHLGRFKKESEAGYAYNQAAIRYFDTFARLNEVKDE